MVFIYILELLSNKFFVGKTNKPTIKLDACPTGDGAAWLAQYPPVRILKTISNCDDFDEDKHTIIMMKKYGIDNVRGGSFSNIILDSTHIDIINRMIRNGTNACYGCGSEGHFIKECNNRDDYVKIYNCVDCDMVYDSQDELTYHRENMCVKHPKCARCGQRGHTQTECVDVVNILNDGLHTIVNLFTKLF